MIDRGDAAMNTPTSPPAVPPRGRPDSDELGAPATQIVRDRDAYLGQNRDVGRRLTEDQFELFVNVDAPFAIEHELQRLTPRFIALHDVGTSSSLRLLAAMAATTEARVLRLTIRRQGHGLALATLQFVEIVAADGATIRAYSTDIDADTPSRHEMARVLLSHATLGVVVFGDLPPHVLKPALQPLLATLGGSPWRTQELLLVPLGAAALLQPFAAAFVAGGVRARVAQPAPRPRDAWSQIGAAWNRLHAAPGGANTAAAPVAPDTGAERTEPMGLRDLAPETHPPPAMWSDYTLRCAGIKGMVSCCVFDRTTGRPLAHAGARPPAELLQMLGERLLLTLGEAGTLLGTGGDIVDAQFSSPTHHVLLHSLPHHRHIVLHAVLDAVHGNLAVTRAQLQRLDPK